MASSGVSSSANSSQRYSVIAVKNLLRLLINDNKLMPLDTPELLRVGYHSEITDAISEAMLPLLKMESYDENAVYEKINSILGKVEYIKKKYEIVEGEARETPVKTIYTKLEDYHHAWGRLLKEWVQKVQFDFQANEEIKKAHKKWIVFLKKQKDFMALAEKNKTDDLLHVDESQKNSISKHFLDFIGKLIKYEFNDMAEVVHNFMYLTTSVLQTQKKSGVDNLPFAVIITSSIREGLQLDDKLYSNSKNRQVIESRFLSLIISVLLDTPAFTEPFSVKNYIVEKVEKSEINSIRQWLSSSLPTPGLRRRRSLPASSLGELSDDDKDSTIRETDFSSPLLVRFDSLALDTSPPSSSSSAPAPSPLPFSPRQRSGSGSGSGSGIVYRTQPQTPRTIGRADSVLSLPVVPPLSGFERYKQDTPSSLSRDLGESSGASTPTTPESVDKTARKKRRKRAGRERSTD